ncbi:MAG TPA: FHA domain-containing protein [Anaerolineae bacterium]|nr:FHA domain-containing protein [Anaerolineae bacterium]
MTAITLEWQTEGKKRHENINGMKAVTIGRHPGCDIVLGDAHVSRRHASISFDGEAFHLHNLSQTNPIIFNERWSLASDLKADLRPGDTFTIGRVRMNVALPQFSSNGNGKNGSNGVHSELRCPSCGQTVADKRATCPLCRVSIAQLETMLITVEG